MCAFTILALAQVISKTYKTLDRALLLSLLFGKWLWCWPVKHLWRNRRASSAPLSPRLFPPLGLAEGRTVGRPFTGLCPVPPATHHCRHWPLAATCFPQLGDGGWEQTLGEEARSLEPKWTRASKGFTSHKKGND